MAFSLSQLWSELKLDAMTLLHKIGDEVSHDIVPILEQDLAFVLSQFKDLALQTVLNLAKAEFSHLSGAEKHGMVVTAVFQAAEAAGKQLAIEDARMFAQQAFNAVASVLKKD